MANNLEDILTPGDKIDIQLSAQANNSEDGSAAYVYKSSISDFLGEKEFEITMPTHNGKMVLFHVGLRLELVIYTQKGLYTCSAAVLDRYRKGNIYLISLEQRSPLKKFQRREYFRIECTIDMSYYQIPNFVADYPRTEMLYQEILKDEYSRAERTGIATDISGGGIRFTGPEELPKGKKILTRMQLSNEKVDRIFFLVAEVIESRPVQDQKDKYVNRCRFLFKELKDREAIVRYVFEEERRVRSLIG